jgi:hypothetical protein
VTSSPTSIPENLIFGFSTPEADVVEATGGEIVVSAGGAQKVGEIAP